MEKFKDFTDVITGINPFIEHKLVNIEINKPHKILKQSSSMISKIRYYLINNDHNYSYFSPLNLVIFIIASLRFLILICVLFIVRLLNSVCTTINIKIPWQIERSVAYILLKVLGYKLKSDNNLKGRII